MMKDFKIRYPLKHKKAKLIFYVFSISIFVLFFTIVYAHVFSSQLGNADDAANALAARNLASGNGYSTSMPFNGSFGIETFPPGITTGPTLVLPVAFFMVIFGNMLWVPGFVVASMCLALLVFIVLNIKKQINLTYAFAFSVLLIFFLYNLTAGVHFAKWYILLGEIPAAFLSILGVFIIAASPDNRKAIVLACLLFGLALTTKLLSLLGFLPVLAWFLYSLIREKNKRKALLINYFYGVLVFAAPFLLFEFWKLFSLGFEGYFENMKRFLHMFERMSGVNDVASNSVYENFILRSEIMSNYSGFSLLLLFSIGTILSIVVYKYSGRKYVRLSFSLLIFGAFFHLFYWTFFSIGWHRFALIGLFMYFAAISFIVFVKLPRPLILVLVVLLLGLFMNPIKRLKDPVTNVMKFGFNHNTRLANLNRTVAFLQDYEQDKPFVYGWWSSIVDVEYAMPTLQNFKRYDHLNVQDYDRDLILVRNTSLQNRTHAERFPKWKKNWAEVLLDAPPFLVSRWKYIPNELVADRNLTFSNIGNSNDYVTYGWGTQTEDFRWTEGYSAGLTFSLRGKPKDSLELKLLGFGYLARGKIKHQLVAVSVNNQFVCEWKIGEEGWNKVRIPPGFIDDDGLVRINFEILNAASPASFGRSNDRRKLGLAVKMISIY